MKTNTFIDAETNNFQLCHTPTVFTKQQYIDIASDLIERTRIMDATVIPHNEEELAYRYDKSLVITNGLNVIGHLALYPAEIPEIEELSVGEIGSVIISSGYRSRGLGEKLITGGIELLSGKYSSLVAATINPTMENIFRKHAFENIPFPESYYATGKKYLSPLMEG
ncbi:MAG: GNAT family N-acetyltransferase, partial [Candidatus Gracilibacteria bacterium]|nr:GNAT family N-acetyltransferase [Candidatus Gracilibacteria bacterium]